MRITVKPEQGVDQAVLSAWGKFFATLATDTGVEGFEHCMIADGFYGRNTVESFDIDTGKFAEKVVTKDRSIEQRNDTTMDYTDPKLVKMVHDKLVSSGMSLPGATSLRPQISSLAQLMENIEGKPIGALKNLEAALANFVVNRYKTNKSQADFFAKGKAIKITQVAYHPPKKNNDGTTSPAYLTVGYMWYHMLDEQSLKYTEQTGILTVKSEDVKSRNLRQWLGELDWLPATDEMVEVQKSVEDRARDIIRHLNYTQVKLVSDAQIRSRGSSRWDANYESDASKNLGEGNGRAIVDFLTKDKTPFNPDSMREFEHPEKCKGLLVCRIPVFHLKHLEMVTVDVSIVQEYVWIENIRDKLVLPHGTQDLLDTLSSDPDLVIEDIVTDKQSASCVLMMGIPGVGKTLSAEVYAEEHKVPLYRVTSGHLGTTAQSVKEGIRRITTRANRWKCPILIDECDVFIRARGFDINQNAIVIAFLEALEYSSNLIWMTTNRGVEIDDAIFSRCIAIVRYEMPSLEERKRLWPILAPQFFPRITTLPNWAELSDRLAEVYDRVAGRDIKMILILARKFDVHHEEKVEWDVERFSQLVAFRRNPNNDLTEEQKLAARKTGF